MWQVTVDCLLSEKDYPTEKEARDGLINALTSILDNYDISSLVWDNLGEVNTSDN